MLEVQNTIDDGIPDSGCTKHILIVHTTTVCHSHCQSDQSEFLFQQVNQFNISDVVVNELLVIFLVQCV